jgi:transcriptional regulator with XRE-family HTH domain
MKVVGFGVANQIKRRDLDWSLVAQNIRLLRQMQDLTRKQVAERAGLTDVTVYNAERGLPVSLRTLRKLASGLTVQLTAICHDRRQVLSKDQAWVIHRAEHPVWSAMGDTRRTARSEGDNVLYEESERRRLADLGFVAGFLRTTSFMMPDGPGIIFVDLYAPNDDALNPRVYQDALLVCLEGEAEVGIRGDLVILKAGDVLGFRPKEMNHLAPGPNVLPSSLPVRLLWIGANRVGRLPEPPRKRSARKP